MRSNKLVRGRMKSYSIFAIIFYLILGSTCFGQLNKGKSTKDKRKPVEEEIKPVEPSALKKLIGEADRIVISESVFEDARVLFTSGDKKDIIEFGDALTIVVPEGLFHDMCLGSTTIRLYRGGIELASITNHHANSIRCSLWTSDVQLLDPDKWIKWFDARKITGPREE